MMRVMVIAALVLLLSGCASNVREVVVTETTTRYVGMDDSWLQSCPTPTPPTVNAAYRGATYPERVDLWTQWYLLQLEETGVRNKALDSAREYNIRKKQEVEVITCKEGVCK